MEAQYVIRSSIGRIITSTDDLQYAYEFATARAIYQGAPCVVLNTANGASVTIDNRGHLATTRAHTGARNA